MNLFNCLILSS